MPPVQDPLYPYQPRAKLTAVVFTFNRRSIVETTLRSARFADRLVVFDKGSTDGTAEIARTYADEVISVPWSPTVEETKAQYLPRVKSDWLLVLDDDECLNATGIEYIRAAVEDGTTDVHYLPFRHFVLGRHDERAYYWPEYRPALFRAGAMEFGSTVHGGTHRVSESHVFVDPDTGVSILHLSHPDAKSWIEKTNRYTDEPSRASSVSASDLTPVRVKEILDRWLAKVPGEEEPYLTAVAALRAIYDMVDAIKLWESQQARPEDPFSSICNELQRQYDALGIERHQIRAAVDQPVIAPSREYQ